MRLSLIISEGFLLLSRLVRRAMLLPTLIFIDPQNILKIKSDWLRYAMLETYFHFLLPGKLRNIRKHFSRLRKGFGENAFFAMWYLIFEKLVPKKVMEIGVYRGQTLAFWAGWSKLSKNDVKVFGVSPFSNAGDRFSGYIDLDYLADVQQTFDQLKLPMFSAIRKYSTDSGVLDALAGNEGTFDVIYVDGGHDLDVVENDVRLCLFFLRTGGIMVLDDACDLISGPLPRGAFRGHQDPSIVAARLSFDARWKLLFTVGHNAVFCKV